MLLSIQRNLQESLAAMRNIMVTMMTRGQTLDQLEAHGALLEQSSELFVVRVLPWWKRLGTRCCGCCGRNGRYRGKRRIVAIDRISENGYMEL